MQTVHFLRNFLCLVACVGNSGDDWLCAYFKRNVQQKYYIIRQIYRLWSICTCSYSEQNATCQYSYFTFYIYHFFKCEQRLHMSKDLCSQRNSFFDKAYLRSNLQHPFKQCYYYIIHAHFSSQFVIHCHNNDFSHREKRELLWLQHECMEAILPCVYRETNKSEIQPHFSCNIT